jgi:hypothetical protein
MEMTHSKYNRIIALLVLGISFTAYLLTVSPTVCFWDCGEYVAAGHSLAVPHPPGNPLFVMISRVFSIMLFFFHEVAFRINIISSITSAFSAMLIYLIVVRVFTGWMGEPDTAWKKIVVYTGAVVGGLFAAFANTVWFCSVEAEVNSPLLLPIALTTWLALVWGQSKDPNRDRLLVLISYIAFLGIGIHMYSMITLPPLFLYVILTDKEKLKDWRLWATVIALGLVIYDISFFFWIGLGTSVVTLVMMLTSTTTKAKWRLCFFLAAFSLLGFSCHLYLPIRSSLNPMIDENHPATLNALDDYLERKQYGSENMITRMFWRRGTWSHQLGVEGHMGFGGFFVTQFYHFSLKDTQESYFTNGFAQGAAKTIVYLLPVFLMVFGMWYLYRKDKNVTVLLTSLFLMTTVVLVFYMNFADGTKPERQDYEYWLKSGQQGEIQPVQREVRVRDYFWVAGFMFYGMWIGIASSAVLYLLYTNRRKLFRTTLAPMCTILFAASPVLPLTQNMALNNRKIDWVPFDYAYNLLMTCEKDGILFTNGDNDTFPLWALQEAYGIRKDVRIVNLSLVNTNWYIKQLKHLDPKVPVSFSDKEIDKLAPQLNPIEQPINYPLREAGINVVLPDRTRQRVLRVQDMMVLNIVDSNKWKKPIYFAITCSDDNFMGLGPYLKMEGLGFRIEKQPVSGSDRLNMSRTVYLMDNVYKFRSLGNAKGALNETSQMLLSNYAALYIQVAFTLQEKLAAMKSHIDQLQANATSADSAAQLTALRKGYNDSLALATDKLQKCIGIMPWDWRPRTLLHQILMESGKVADAERNMRDAMKADPTRDDYKKMLAQALESEGKKKEAIEVLKQVVNSENSDPWTTYASLAENYAGLQMYDSAISVMQLFSETHPGDRRASDMINRFQSMKSASGKAPVESSTTPPVLNTKPKS